MRRPAIRPPSSAALPLALLRGLGLGLGLGLALAGCGGGDGGDGGGGDGGHGPIVEPGDPGAADVAIEVRTDTARLPISPLVYGLNGGADVARDRPRLVRAGGNRLTAYNWENNASNAGEDYCNQNDGLLGAPGSPPASAFRALLDARGAFCTDADGQWGRDCSTPPDPPSPVMETEVRGRFVAAHVGVAAELLRHRHGWFQGGRLAFTAAGGTMPHVEAGARTRDEAYFSVGLTLAIAVGASE